MGNKTKNRTYNLHKTKGQKHRMREQKFWLAFCLLNFTFLRVSFTPVSTPRKHPFPASVTKSELSLCPSAVL